MDVRPLPAVVDLSTTQTVAGQSVRVTTEPTTLPVHRPRFTRDAVADPGTLAQELARLERAHHDATWAQRAHPMHAPVTFKNVSFTSGQVTYLVHGLGASVNWMVVGWRNASVGASLWESATAGDQTTSRLALAAGATGTADLMVWRRP